MKKNRSLFVLAGLALLAALLTFYVLRASVRPVQVVVARQDLGAGTLLSADLLEVRTFPQGGVPQGTFSNPSDLVGKTLTVERVAGDPLTSYVVGDAGVEAGIPAMLDPGTVAIAVHVDQATGLAGVLRPGQKVTVIGIIDPSAIRQGQTTSYAAPAPDLGLAPTSEVPTPADQTPMPTSTPAPTATSQPPVSPVARVAVSGLKVLVVPQAFRYQEVTGAAGTAPDALLPVSTSPQDQNSSVILLEASIQPQEIAPGVVASPAEVLALLNDAATIHLVLEPASGIQVNVAAEGVDLAKLYQALTGYKLIP